MEEAKRLYHGTLVFSHKPSSVLLLLVIKCVSPAFCAMFCPVAITNQGYEIVVEQYHLSSQAEVTVTWFFNEQQLATCNTSQDSLTNEKCGQDPLFPDQATTYTILRLYNGSLQLSLHFPNFFSELIGNYTVIWETDDGATVQDSCLVDIGDPVDECTRKPSCQNSVNCTQLSPGFYCLCWPGYNGKICSQADFSVHCLQPSFKFEFNQSFTETLCNRITLDCYLSGMGWVQDITAVAVTSSIAARFFLQVENLNNSINFTACILNDTPPGTYEVQYEMVSKETTANSTKFDLSVAVEETNVPPTFNNAAGRYYISIDETNTVDHYLEYVLKSRNKTCQKPGVCIQVIDINMNELLGIGSLKIIVTEFNQTSERNQPIVFQPDNTPDSLGYFQNVDILQPNRSFIFFLNVTDGGGASVSAEVIFNITDVNDPPSCNLSGIQAELSINVVPPASIGSVSCYDKDLTDLFRSIQYSLEGNFTDYFQVSSSGAVSLIKSLLPLEIWDLSFLVQASGYTDDVSSAQRFQQFIPVHVLIEVPAPDCSLSISDTPSTWMVRAVAHLDLMCETYGVDKLQVISWNFNNSFSIQTTKVSPSQLKINLEVLQYQSGQYDLQLAVSLGQGSSNVSVVIPMYNGPVFSQVQNVSVPDVAPLGTTLLNFLVSTDVPNAVVTCFFVGNSNSLFQISELTESNWQITLEGSLQPFTDMDLSLTILAQDNVSSLFTDILWNLSIVDTNQPPVCNGPADVTVTSDLSPDVAFTYVFCQDPDKNPSYNTLTYTIQAATGHQNVSVSINQSGYISLKDFLPSNETLIQVQVLVSDGAFNILVNFNITVIIVKCKPDVTDYNLTFPETPVNSEVTVNCTSLYSGQVSRYCFRDRTWGPFTYSGCRRRDLEATLIELKQIIQSLANYSDDQLAARLRSVSRSLTKSLQMSSTILSGDINQMADIFKNVAKITQLSETVELDGLALQAYVGVANSLIGAPFSMWAEAGADGGEEGAVMLASLDAIVSAGLREVFDISETEVMTNIVYQRAVSIEDVQFPGSIDNITGRLLSESILLNKKTFQDFEGSLRYAVLIYMNVTDKIKINESKQNDALLKNKVLNSNIISFSINVDISELTPPVEITFTIDQKNYSNPRCAFLDTDNSQDGVWSTRGCKSSSQGNLVTCSCNHLTNFAVLMSPFPVDAAAEVLSIISIVGCGISIVCLVITILVYAVLWRYVRSDRAVLHMNLSVCLVIAYIIFLAGVDRTENQIACTVVAVLLHYTFLVVFCVMMCEGIEIYKAVSFVFSSKSILRYLLPICYGVPVVIVSVSLGVTRTEGYGTSTSCWLSTEDGLIWAFVGPALLTLLINILILIHVLRIMQQTKSMEKKALHERTKSVIRTILILSPLLGLTWVFGVLSVNRDTLVFQYLFAILNSLQGFMIFICYCPMTQQVRDGFKAIRRKHSASSFNSLQQRGMATPSPHSGRHSTVSTSRNRFKPQYLPHGDSAIQIKKKVDNENSHDSGYQSAHSESRDPDSYSGDWWQNGKQPSKDRLNSDLNELNNHKNKMFHNGEVTSYGLHPSGRTIGPKHELHSPEMKVASMEDPGKVYLATSYTSYSDNYSSQSGQHNHGYQSDSVPGIFNSSHQNQQHTFPINQAPVRSRILPSNLPLSAAKPNAFLHGFPEMLPEPEQDY